MRKKLTTILLQTVLIGLISGSNVMAGTIGSSLNHPQKGRILWGVGYNYDQYKLQAKNSGWVDAFLKQNQSFIQLQYGLTESANLYGRLGASDLKIKDAWASADDLDADFRFLGTIGYKQCLYNDGKYGIGAFVETSFFDNYHEDNQGVSAKFDDLWTLNTGFSLEKDMGNLVLYGGPLFYWARSNVKASSANGGTFLGQVVGDASTDYEEKTNYGAFIGVDLALTDYWVMNVETQYKDKFSVGLSVHTYV